MELRSQEVRFSSLNRMKILESQVRTGENPAFIPIQLFSKRQIYEGEICDKRQ